MWYNIKHYYQIDLFCCIKFGWNYFKYICCIIAISRKPGPSKVDFSFVTEVVNKVINTDSFPKMYFACIDMETETFGSECETIKQGVLLPPLTSMVSSCRHKKENGSPNTIHRHVVMRMRLQIECSMSLNAKLSSKLKLRSAQEKKEAKSLLLSATLFS